MSSVADALAEKGIHADRDGLHLLPPEQLQQSVALQEECKEFLSKTKQFNEIVADFITVMEGKSKVAPPAAPYTLRLGLGLARTLVLRLTPAPNLSPILTPILPGPDPDPGPGPPSRHTHAPSSPEVSGRAGPNLAPTPNTHHMPGDRGGEAQGHRPR